MEGGTGNWAAGVSAPDTEAMTAPRRRARLVAAALVFGLLVAGTAWGQDDHFPFGPFRMYATRQRLDGATTWYQIEAVTSDGDRIFLPGPAYGMRRAELEGQLPRFVAEPALLAELAAAYERRRPTEPGLVEIHLVRRRQPLAGGRPVGEPTDKTVATWRP